MTATKLSTDKTSANTQIRVDNSMIHSQIRIFSPDRYFTSRICSLKASPHNSDL